MYIYIYDTYKHVHIYVQYKEGMTHEKQRISNRVHAQQSIGPSKAMSTASKATSKAASKSSCITPPVVHKPYFDTLEAA